MIDPAQKAIAAEQTTKDVDGMRLIAKGIEMQSSQRAVEAALRWAWTKYVVDEPRKAETGHAPDCQLAAAIKAAKGE